MRFRGAAAVDAQVKFRVLAVRPAVGPHNSQAVVNWRELQNRLATIVASIISGRQWTQERPSERPHQPREVTHYHGADGRIL